MTKRTVLLSIVLAVSACETPREDRSQAHILANLPNADFAVMVSVEEFSSCAGAGRCRATDQPSGVMRVQPISSHFGTMSGRYSVLGTVAPDSLSWWSKGQPVRLLLIGRNGAPQGWSAPKAHPPDDPTTTLEIEPVCGLSPAESVAVPDFATYVYDEVHRTFVDTAYLGGMHQLYAASGRDYDNNIVPDSIGSRDVRKPIEDGWVIEQERVEEDLRVAAQQAVERKQFDDTFNTGTCVLAQ